jgi:hypothetical protein
MWGAVFFIPSSLFFLVGYRGSRDAMNNDAYHIINDAFDTSAANLHSHTNFSVRYVFYYGLDPMPQIKMQFLSQSYSIKDGYLIMKVFQRIGRVAFPPSREITVYYASGSIACANNMCDFWVRSSVGNASFFSFSKRIEEPDMYSKEPNVSCLEKVSLIFSNYTDFSVFKMHRLLYTHTVTSSCPTEGTTVEVHDATEPLPYSFPEVRYISLFYLALVFLCLSAFGLCAFIWHCWSVRFTIIKKAIHDSGLTIRGRRVAPDP